jgi:hypothetical protein
MFYIPKEWLINKENEGKVHEILNEHLASDINTDVDVAIKQLKDINETIIIEKIVDGTITFN